MTLQWLGRPKSRACDWRSPALTVTLMLVLVGACTDDRPTEPNRHAEQSPNVSSAGVLRDDFTDADGTLLEDHTPDGGSEPFSWIRAPSFFGSGEAIIQDGALIGGPDHNWIYTPSRPAVDWIELTIDVLEDPTGEHNHLVIWLRGEEDDLDPSYQVQWVIGGAAGNWLGVSSEETGFVTYQLGPVAPGPHTFRAEINPAGEMELSVDGQVHLTHPLGTLRPPGRTGIGMITSTGGPATVRITSFSAATQETVPPIQVTCNPSPVTRGDPVTCTASPPNPNDEFTVSEWRFDGSLLSGPIVEASTSTTWSGVAAATGIIRVKGTIGGVPANGDGQLIVAARNWSGDTVAYRIRQVTPSALPARPTRVGELGNTGAVAGGFVAAGGFSQITSGPNQGVLYVTQVPVKAESRVDINGVALSLNSDFYLLQPKKLKKSDPPGTCTRADVLPFLPEVERHEGLHLEPNSHTFVFRRELNLNVPQATEHVVSLGDIALLQSLADAAAQPGIQAALQKAADQINGGTVPPVPWCNFAFFTGP